MQVCITTGTCTWHTCNTLHIKFTALLGRCGALVENSCTVYYDFGAVWVKSLLENDTYQNAESIILYLHIILHHIYTSINIDTCHFQAEFLPKRRP